MARRVGVRKAVLSTTHALTGGQHVVDGSAKKPERGRAGVINTVPTRTGAAEATTKVLPDFEGRFDGLALRVPIAVGSIADVTFVTERATSAEEVNGLFQEEAESDRYREILGWVDEPVVSADIIRDPRASVVDLGLTRVVDSDLVKVMAWYDNEWAYAQQMVREGVRAVSEA